MKGAIKQKRRFKAATREPSTSSTASPARQLVAVQLFTGYSQVLPQLGSPWPILRGIRAGTASPGSCSSPCHPGHRGGCSSLAPRATGFICVRVLMTPAKKRSPNSPIPHFFAVPNTWSQCFHSTPFPRKPSSGGFLWRHKAGPAAHSWSMKSEGAEDAQQLRESQPTLHLPEQAKNPEATRKQRKKTGKRASKREIPSHTALPESSSTAWAQSPRELVCSGQGAARALPRAPRAHGLAG